MSSDTTLVLIGKVHHEMIAEVIRQKYDVDVDIKCNSLEGSFTISFLEPHPELSSPGSAKGRLLYFSSSDHNHDYDEVYAGDKVVASLGFWGSSVDIMTALAEEFGGFVLPDDSWDSSAWVPVEKKGILSVEQSDISKLKLSLAEFMPVKDAVAFSKLMSDPDKLSKITSALNAYEATLMRTQTPSM